MDKYNTIKNSATGGYKDKGSKFISFAVHVENVDEVMEVLKDKRKEYFDARHVCYAYMLGADKEVFRANDDGEPSGTAGKPILGQINSNDLTNILVIVVRYFGGILLGTSGLINAYKLAAADAISNAKKIVVNIERQIIVFCDYDNLNFVMRAIKDFDLKILEQKQHMNCTFTLSCKQANYDMLISKLNENYQIKYKEVD